MTSLSLVRLVLNNPGKGFGYSKFNSGGGDHPLPFGLKSFLFSYSSLFYQFLQLSTCCRIFSTSQKWSPIEREVVLEWFEASWRLYTAGRHVGKWRTSDKFDHKKPSFLDRGGTPGFLGWFRDFFKSSCFDWFNLGFWRDSCLKTSRVHLT